MERDVLCDTCLVKCWFRTEANNVAENTLIEPSEKHKQITDLRQLARLRECRNLNNIDPDYPGKDKL